MRPLRVKTVNSRRVDLSILKVIDYVVWARVSAITIQHNCCIVATIVMNMQYAAHLQETENKVS
jgi:macrodomain Ter protein organizer (MatP/YcbG family)